MLTEIWVQKLIEISAIIIAGTAIDRISRILFRRAFQSLPSQRAKTLLSLTQNSVSFALGIVILGMILSKLGLNIAPLIASAGILGLAIGFGAQTLVKDIISGLFLLLEDTIRTGETVQVAGVKGKVKQVGLRTLELEDDQGVIQTIPNGSISTVANFSRKKKS